MIASSYEKDERKSRQLSLLLTLIGVGGFLVLAYFWVVLRGTIPPQDENPYIVVGRVDFGGVGGNPPPGPPTAVESPPSSAHPSVKEAPPPSKSENLATSPAPSPVKSPLLLPLTPNLHPRRRRRGRRTGNFPTRSH